MKHMLLLFLLSGWYFTASAQNNPSDTLIVEASCGQCKFEMKGKGCTLAVRINGKAYFAYGTTIDDHGDAHAEDGFCNKIRKARVVGEILDEKFKVAYFKLLPETK